jgi:type VI secretion system secreted protein Hcp
MSVDMFLKLDGIKGEAMDSKHKDTIDVLAWSWSMSQSGTTHMGSGSGSGKVSVQDLSLTKYVDKASATLIQHACTGKHITKGQLIVRKAGDKPLEYVTIDLEDIIVTQVSSGGSGGEDRITENVTLNFANFKYTYTTQAKDGSAGPKVDFGWKIAQNVKA